MPPTVVGMTLTWTQIVIDSDNPRDLAHWWSDVLGWPITYEADDEEEVEIAPHAEAQPSLLFVPVPEKKSLKNRLHLDFRPDDQTAEVERLLAAGATRADVGQGDDVSWVVLADPEGNEFCVLRAR
jgi:predicted enzyme related to lactoylglutathione lyase